ncbi:hypothetical protein PI124_g11022 [Phytophthora idaei]|nr:hypothetical protein PI126_g13610 [Phytophthora idaei]KAG3244189.1 hypothetical protein PI124_g11022 [Phytophthora idaei]
MDGSLGDFMNGFYLVVIMSKSLVAHVPVLGFDVLGGVLIGWKGVIVLIAEVDDGNWFSSLRVIVLREVIVCGGYNKL